VAPGYVLTVYSDSGFVGWVRQVVGHEDTIIDFASSLEIMPAALPTATGADVIVVVYYDDNYRNCFNWYYSSVKDTGFFGEWNDKMSSVGIADSRYKVILYQDAFWSGESKEFLWSEPNLHNYSRSGGTWGDSVSSLEVKLK